MTTSFTPYASLLGGVMIGLAATLLMIFLGRVAGVTGILAGALLPSGHGDWLWRVAFLAGMISAPILAFATAIPVQPIEIPAETFALAVGGMIVGCGVTLGSGCTSGHGVCGLARFSLRSLIATLVFMVTTGMTVYFVRHVWGG